MFWIKVYEFIDLPDFDAVEKFDSVSAAMTWKFLRRCPDSALLKVIVSQWKGAPGRRPGWIMGFRDVRVRDEYSSIRWVFAIIPLAN